MRKEVAPAGSPLQGAWGAGGTLAGLTFHSALSLTEDQEDRGGSPSAGTRCIHGPDRKVLIPYAQVSYIPCGTEIFISQVALHLSSYALTRPHSLPALTCSRTQPLIQASLLRNK